MAKKKPGFLFRNGLTLVFLSMFLITLLLQAYTGWKTYNEELHEKGVIEVRFDQYLRTGHFVSATFENFESEFLQMALYVVLTIYLRQIGSAESKSLTEKEETDREPQPTVKDTPWPVRQGGWILKLYSHSLSIAFALLFLSSWAIHFYGSWKDENIQQQIAGNSPVTMQDFLTGPRFWFETFQNWQSEFLSVLSIVFLTIYLRQKGSPESKPVDAPHMETGK